MDLSSLELLDGNWTQTGSSSYRRTIEGDASAVIVVFAVKKFICPTNPSFGYSVRWNIRYNWQTAESVHTELAGALTEANSLCRSMENSLCLPMPTVYPELELSHVA